MKVKIFLEGGGDKYSYSPCREAFAKYLEKLGLAGKTYRVACGGRGQAYKRYCAELKRGGDPRKTFLWVDSENPIAAADLTTAVGDTHPRTATWSHLKKRDNWAKPVGAEDDDVLLIATCLETWIVADRAAMKKHYNGTVQESALPSLVDLEKRDRHAVQDALEHATRNCKNSFEKGKRAFKAFAEIDPAVVEQHCPEAVRCREILKARCR